MRYSCYNTPLPLQSFCRVGLISGRSFAHRACSYDATRLVLSIMHGWSRHDEETTIELDSVWLHGLPLVFISFSAYPGQPYSSVVLLQARFLRNPTLVQSDEFSQQLPPNLHPYH